MTSSEGTQKIYTMKDDAVSATTEAFSIRHSRPLPKSTRMEDLRYPENPIVAKQAALPPLFAQKLTLPTASPVPAIPPKALLAFSGATAFLISFIVTLVSSAP